MSLSRLGMRAQIPRVSEVSALEIRCDDCGRVSRIEGDILARTGDCSLAEIRTRLVCSSCKERGQMGRNVEAIPILRRAR